MKTAGPERHGDSTPTPHRWPLLDTAPNEAPYCENSTGISSDHRHVKQYTHAKQAVARCIRGLESFLRKRASTQRAQAAHELMVKLAEDRFTLAVVGQFKRGKSSLMNAIVGRDLLPTGILPMTSAITIVRFGTRERLVIPKPEIGFDQEAPLSSLAEYVTQSKNPGNHQGLRAVYVETPLAFLRRGMEFVDTPGIGSALETNTQTTLQFVPSCDAMIFVTSVESPLSTPEMQFLQRIRQYVRKLFFVVNKVDLLGPEQRDQVMRYVSDTLHRELGVEVNLFPVSTRRALDAKSKDDQTGLDDSGIGALESALDAFLATDRFAVFLASILDRAMGILTDESREINIQMHLRGTSQKLADQQREQFQTRLIQLKEERLLDHQRWRERITCGCEVRVGRLVHPLLRQEIDPLMAELGRILRSRWWRRSGAIVREFGASATGQIRGDLAIWANSQCKLFHEWLAAESQTYRGSLPACLSAVTSAATSAFGLASEKAPPRNKEILPEPVMATPTLAVSAWRPRLPLAIRWMPALLTHFILHRHLRESLGRHIAGVTSSVCRDFVKVVQSTFDQFAKQIEQSVAQNEQRLLQAAKDETFDVTRAETGDVDEDERTILAGALSSLQEIFVHHGLEGVGAWQFPSIVPASQAPSAGGMKCEIAPAANEYFAWSKLLQSRRCPICAHLQSVLFDFLARAQAELASDDESQRTFAQAAGFCPLHSWQLAALGSPVGLSAAYIKLAERFSADLLRFAEEPENTGLRTISPTARTCEACRAIRDAENAILLAFIRRLAESEFRITYGRSEGLCLRHLQAIDHQDIANWLPFLMSHAGRQFDLLSEDMQTFVLKRAATRANLTHRDERDAYLRTISMINGDRSFATLLATQ